jgi:hypothetical protein
LVDVEENDQQDDEDTRDLDNSKSAKNIGGGKWQETRYEQVTESGSRGQRHDDLNVRSGDAVAHKNTMSEFYATIHWSIER